MSKSIGARVGKNPGSAAKCNAIEAGADEQLVWSPYGGDATEGREQLGDWRFGEVKL